MIIDAVINSASVHLVVIRQDNEHPDYNADIELCAQLKSVIIIRRNEYMQDASDLMSRFFIPDKVQSLLQPLLFWSKIFPTSRLIVNKLQRALLRSDVIVLRYMESWVMSRASIPRHTAVVLDADDFESHYIRSRWGANRNTWTKFFRYTILLLIVDMAWKIRSRNFQCIFMATKREITLAKKLGIKNPIAQIKNSAIPPIVIPAWPTEFIQISAIFVGLLTHEPNANGVKWFISHVLPMIKATISGFNLIVVGKGWRLNEWSDADGVIYRGESLSLQSEYEKSTFSICPCFFGGGSNIKIIESYLYGRPCVATNYSAGGFIDSLTIGVDIFTADNARDFAAACIALASDPGFAQKTGRCGMMKIRKYHSKEQVVKSIKSSLASRLQYRH